MAFAFTHQMRYMKCKECEFTTTSKHELEVHKGEKHKIALLCEICDFKAQKKSILEIHLATCELYKCSKCEFKSRRLSQVKTHTNKLHGSGDHFLHHLKTDRNNIYEVCSTVHYFADL